MKILKFLQRYGRRLTSAINLYRFHILLFLIGCGFGGHIYLFFNYRNICSRRISTLNKGVKERVIAQSNLIFVGVMTSHNFLNTRSKAVYETWAQKIPGKVMFFTSFNSSTDLHLPLVKLRAVDDSYPPQKKSFKMLKYMYDNWLNNFKWFMRADDDVYVKPEKLLKFLNSLDHSKPYLIGQASYQSKHNGNLSLEAHENYCMGGPGVIMSREVLRRIGPHLHKCIKNLYTKHEDVEIGRCIQDYAKTNCTWSLQMEQLFHHYYINETELIANPFNTKVISSISVHPFKDSNNLYKLKIFFHRYQIMELRKKRRELERNSASLVEKLFSIESIISDNLKLMKTPRSILQITRSIRKDTKQQLNHSEIRENRFKYNIMFFRPPKYVEKQWRDAVSESLRQVSVLNNPILNQTKFLINWHRAHYYLRNYDPLQGLHYTFFYYRHLRKNSKMPLKQGSLKIVQPFDDIFFREDTFYNSQFYNTSKKAHSNFNKDLQINFIVPLSGRFDRFQDFIRNFEEVCFKSNEKVTLKLVLFTKTNSTSFTTLSNDEQSIMGLFDSLKNKYPLHKLDVLILSGNFSRGVACQEGASNYENNSLLVFIDIDISFDFGFLTRVRMNTLMGKQVYFPIVFSQYEYVPESYSNDSLRNYTSTSIIERSTGYWRQYGYGMASMYKADLEAVKGFNTGIVGWGLEDVDLFDRFTNASYTIFRSVDPGLVHVYHGIECDETLDKHRYKMCKTNFYSTYGSQVDLAKKVYQSL